MKIVITIFVAINVVYGNHTCEILLILQRTSTSNIYAI